MNTKVELPEEDAKEMLIFCIRGELDGYSIRRDYVLKLFDLVYPQLSKKVQYATLERLKELVYDYLVSEPPNHIEMYWQHFLDRIYDIEYEFFSDGLNGEENK